jgi:hypothetical protein
MADSRSMLLVVFAFPTWAPFSDSSLEPSASLEFKVVPSSTERVKQFAAVVIIPELIIRQSKQPVRRCSPIGEARKAPCVDCKLRKEVRLVNRPPMQLITRDVREFCRKAIK